MTTIAGSVDAEQAPLQVGGSSVSAGPEQEVAVPTPISRT
jgi:hypothetical protein